MSSFFGPTISDVQNHQLTIDALSLQAKKEPAKFARLADDVRNAAEKAVGIANTVITNLNNELKEKQAAQTKLVKEQQSNLTSAAQSATAASTGKTISKGVQKIQELTTRIVAIKGELELAKHLNKEAESILNLPKAFKAARLAEIDKLSEELANLETRPILKVATDYINVVEKQTPTFSFFGSPITAGVEALKAIPNQTTTLEAEFAYRHALLFALKTNDDPEFIKANKELVDTNEALIQNLKKRSTKLSTLLDSARNIASKLEKAIPYLTGKVKTDLELLLQEQKILIETLEEANNPAPSKKDSKPGESSSAAAAAATPAAVAGPSVPTAVDAKAPPTTAAATKEVAKTEEKKKSYKISPMVVTLIATNLLWIAAFAYTGINSERSSS